MILLIFIGGQSKNRTCDTRIFSPILAIITELHSVI